MSRTRKKVSWVVDWDNGTVVDGMPSSVYRAHEGISWSDSKDVVLTSPAHCRWRAEHPPEGPELLFGTAFHVAATEPEEFIKRFSVWDSGPRRGEAWESFESGAKELGRVVICADDATRARDMAKAVRECDASKAMLVGGRAERSLFWTDKATGARCKARLDYLGPRGLIDLKSCRSADPRQFSSAAFSFGYVGQVAGWYRAGCIACGLEPGNGALIAVEKSPPYIVQVYRFTDSVCRWAEKQREEVLALYLSCKKSGQWPGYSDSGESELEVPGWVSGVESDGGLGLITLC